jgi:hypothetical protein
MLAVSDEARPDRDGLSAGLRCRESDTILAVVSRDGAEARALDDDCRARQGRSTLTSNVTLYDVLSRDHGGHERERDRR